MARATPIPDSARIAVETRDGGCVRCGAPGGNFHHRRSRSVRDALTHSPGNAVILCGSGTTLCHGWVHAHPAEARGSGWIVSRFIADPATEPVWTIRHGWVLLDHDGHFTLARDTAGEDRHQ